MQDDYWEESAKPLNSLLLVMPLLLVYELGMLWLGTESPRNGADVWLRLALESMGLARFFFLPCLTCGILLAWHHVSGKRWRFDVDVISGMICECVLLGISLVVLASVYASAMGNSVSVAANSAALVTSERIPLILSYLGAGIYEELLFRLILLSGIIAAARHFGADICSAILLGVISSSLLFAAAHYRMFFDVGGAFSWYSFAFRIGAGALFSILFLKRGFGIAVGTHAAYDVLVATTPF